MPLDLVVPDLLLPAEAPDSMRQLRLPALEKWLVRGHVSRVEAKGVEPLFAKSFGLAEPLPVAAITLASDDEPREGTWLRADPVHLRIDQQAVALHHGAMLGVTRDESTTLVAALQSLFAADGFEFLAPGVERWYVRIPPDELPETTPLDDVLGGSVFGLLPRGNGKINWASAITETQMLMSTHPVNEARERAGHAAINSVWFWGGGATPAVVSSPYALIYADDPFARGLARLSGTRLAELPPSLARIDAVREGESVLLVLDSLVRPLQRGDEAGWRAAAEALERDWFGALGEAIDRFETVRLVLPGPQHAVVAHLTHGARWRWLRRRKPLAAHA